MQLFQVLVTVGASAFVVFGTCMSSGFAMMYKGAAASFGGLVLLCCRDWLSLAQGSGLVPHEGSAERHI